MEAWEELNEAFITADGRFHFSLGNNALYLYDLVIGIREPKIDPEFDFGRHFNYTPTKWSSLVANYVDREKLEQIKEQVTKAEKKKRSLKAYNIALNFSNKHAHGKQCLLSMVFSHRAGDTKATISVFLRASEVTKRLICDLLLFQRIGEHVYGDIPFQLILHFNQVFNDNNVLLMYDVHKSIKTLLKGKEDPRSIKMLASLRELKSKSPDEVKYKVYRRVAKVLQPDGRKYPRTLAKNCTL